MGFDNYFYPSNMIASENYFGLSGPLGLKKFMLDFYPSHLGQIKFYSHLYPSNIKPSHNHLGQVGFFTLPNMMASEGYFGLSRPLGFEKFYVKILSTPSVPNKFL